MKKNIFTFLVFSTYLFSFGTVNIISFGSEWKYLANGTNQRVAWRSGAFNDAAWLSGSGQFGYGDGDETTVVEAGCSPLASCGFKHITTYFRKKITIGNTSTYSNYSMRIKRDDGIVVYIDGKEVFRNNMPTDVITYSTLASSDITDDGNTLLNKVLPLSKLKTGTHVIAVEIHQFSTASDDISFDLKLTANEISLPPPPPPGSATLLRGPYLNAAGQTSIHVRWRTDLPTNSVVNFGLFDGSLTSNVTDTNLVTEHDVTITGLDANTKYFYSIGNTDPIAQTYKSGSNIYFNTTPPKTEDKVSRFVVFGDCGNNSTNQTNVRNSVMQFLGSDHADGMLLLGNNALTTGSDAEYQTNFFNQYQDTLLNNVTLWAAPGDADYANSPARQNDHAIPYYDIFTNPTVGESGGVPSGTESYYSYDYGNVHFLSLDSYGKDASTYRLFDTTGPQVDWIKADLTANKLRWTVVYFNQPAYTMGSDNSDTDPDLIALRQNLIQILERYGVDLILNAHSTVYERSYLLNGHYGNEASFNLGTHALSASSAKYDGSGNSCPYIKNNGQKAGTVYAVVGSSGQLGGAQPSWTHEAMSYSNNLNGGAMVIKVDGNRLDADWVCDDGVVRDRFTIMKDVNKNEPHSIYLGDLLTLTSSWKGSYNWYDGSSTNSVDVSPPNSEVIDTLFVTDNYGCLTDSFTIVKLLPFKDPNTTSTDRKATTVVKPTVGVTTTAIKVYPNPSTTGIFTVDYTSDKNINSNIVVYDITGNIVLQDEFVLQEGTTNHTLNISNLASGSYLLKVEDKVVRIQK
ncbi:MAG TPA: T9SS type A sorting domain-containing protein [Chitinophagales bacterium]|nr:T9SS type A sorting domain-containing protein [Chitinophagales bacterium]